MNNKLLKYNIDIIPVGVVLLCLMMSLLPLFISFHPLILAFYFLTLIMMKNSTLCIQHNHAHLKTFNSKVLNFIFDTLLAQTTGYSTPEWELQHNLGHHRNYMTPENDPATTIDLLTNKTMTLWEYVFQGSLRIFPDAFKIARQEALQGNSKIMMRFMIHVAIQISLTIILLYQNFVMALIFFVISNFVARALVWWGSYWHHANVPRTGIYDSSVTCTDRILNIISFNNGHHTVHHEKPTLHWSLLPQRTEMIIDKIPATCLLAKMQ